MKIFLINPSPGNVGGITSHLANLEKRLKHDQIPCDIIAIDSYGASNNPFISLLRLFRKLFRTPNFQEAILHFHTSKKALPFLLAILPLWLIRKNSVLLSIHSGQYIEWLNYNLFYRFLHRLLLPLATRVVFMNEAQAREIKLLFPKIRVNWSTPFIAVNSVHNVRKAVPSLHYPLKLIGSGMWADYYRHEDLIEAAEQTSLYLSLPVELTLVMGTANADLNYRQRIFNLIQHKQYEKLNVLILEDCHEMLKQLADNDIYVRSSSVDSYGLSVAEALYVNTPSVATDVCPRPKGTKLYKAGRVASLKECLLETYKELIEDRIPLPLLPESSDGFNTLYHIYQEFDPNHFAMEKSTLPSHKRKSASNTPLV